MSAISTPNLGLRYQMKIHKKCLKNMDVDLVAVLCFLYLLLLFSGRKYFFRNHGLVENRRKP